MLYTTLLGLVAVAQAAVTPRGTHSSTETVELYAYGPDIPGYAVYAGSDDLAYIAAPTTNLTALTWTIDASGTNAWTVTANSTSSSSSLDSGSVFYVVTSDGATDAAGFAATAADAPSGAVTTGFVTYGTYVMLAAADAKSGHRAYESKFVAVNTTTTSGVWSLVWDSNMTAQADAFPVSLRTKPFVHN